MTKNIMKKKIVTKAFLLEFVEQPDGTVTYIVRLPQTGQVVALCNDSADVAKFLDELKNESEDE